MKQTAREQHSISIKEQQKVWLDYLASFKAEGLKFKAEPVPIRTDATEAEEKDEEAYHERVGEELCYDWRRGRCCLGYLDS